MSKEVVDNFFLKNNLIKLEKILNILFLIILIGSVILNFTVNEVIAGYFTAFAFGGFAVMLIYYKVIHKLEMEE